MSQEPVSSNTPDCRKYTSFEAVDLIKLICALLVVAIHVHPFDTSDAVVLQLASYGIRQYLARLAVPFFFMCTGFFVFRKADLNAFSPRYPLAQARKNYRLYLIWTLIYAPIWCRKLLALEAGALKSILLFAQRFIFSGCVVFLWYLPAVVFALLLISFLLAKKVRIPVILAIAGGLYLIGLLPQSYPVLLQKFGGGVVGCPAENHPHHPKRTVLWLPVCGNRGPVCNHARIHTVPQSARGVCLLHAAPVC